MNKHNLSALAEKLSKLKDGELVKVLEVAFSGREPYEDPLIESSTFVLGIAYKQEGKHGLDIVAYPDPAEYGEEPGPDWGFAQRSPSEIENTDYVSNCKKCISPLSRRTIGLT